MKSLVFLLFLIFPIASFQPWWDVVYSAVNLQSTCINSVIGNEEIITRQSLDVNQDGILDQIVLYGKDKVNIGVILNDSSLNCRIVLDDTLTPLVLANPTSWRTVQLRQIEMIELTGDNKPELHIWLEKTNAPSRYEHAVHAIYTFVNEKLQKILLTEQCLIFSSFEFQGGETGGPKNIYLDTDSQCQPPWSFQRNYTTMKWNGSRFIPSQSGTIKIFTTYPPWWNIFCLIVVIGPIVVFTLLIVHLKKRNKKSKL